MRAAAQAVVVALGLTLALISPHTARADMGAIVPSAHVTVSEPGQKAIIAHDGFEEVFILGTDMEASAVAEALRFIPLPGETQVRLADEEVFAELERMMSAHGMRYLIKRKDGAVWRCPRHPARRWSCASTAGSAPTMSWWCGSAARRRSPTGCGNISKPEASRPAN
jgi:hypothetical protein